MIQKIKRYFKVFGFKQTVLKLFRYTNEKLHTDACGVYTPTKKELRSIIQKQKRVYIFSDTPFSASGEETASKYAVLFNDMGCAVSYYLIGNKPIKQKNPPLCFYGKLTSKEAKNINFEKSIVVLDTESEMRLAISYKTKSADCIVIDSRTADRLPDLDICADCLNKLYRSDVCPSKYYNNISVIVLNYNNKKVIFNCIDTIKKYNGKYNCEIIVVDNQSTDGSFEELSERYNDIKLLRNTKNGCSSGRNLGIENASKDYVIFLDSDQWILHKNWLDVYFDIFDSDEIIGAIGWAAGWFNKKGYSYHTVNNFSYGYMPPKALCRCDIGYLGTGGMMLSKRLLQSVDCFDLYYDPTCYEDTDISLKVRNAGKEIYYCSYLGVGHLPHQTTNSGSDAHERLIKEKGDYFVSKWKKINPSLLKYIK